MSDADHQTLRLLPGRYVLERGVDVGPVLNGEVLAGGAVPVWVAASFDGDLVLIPADRVDEATELLSDAGHHVLG